MHLINTVLEFHRKSVNFPVTEKGETQPSFLKTEKKNNYRAVSLNSMSSKIMEQIPPGNYAKAHVKQRL